MPITIQTNTTALAARKHLSSAVQGLSSSMTKLSSGSKINSAKDDAAGLQISNRLNTQSRGLDVAVRNANDAISTLQVADGALNEYTEIIFKIRDLSLQSVNGSNSKEDVESTEKEIRALGDELNRIVSTSKFGGETLFTGSKDKNTDEDKVIGFQVGSNSGEVINCTLPNLDSLQNEALITHSFLTADSTKSKSGDAIPKDWKTAEGDYMEFYYPQEGKSGSEVIKRIDFSEGEPIEGVVNKLNSAFNNKVRFYITEVKDELGKTCSKLGYSYERGNKLSGITTIGLSKQHFSTLKNSNGGQGSLIYSPSFFTLDGPGGILRRSFNDVISGNFPLEELNNDTNHINALNSLTHFCDIILSNVDSYRAGIGSSINRLEHSIKNLSSQNINTNDSKSRIKDTDFAKETTELTKQSILKEVGTSMLAQAKESSNNALNLLG